MPRGRRRAWLAAYGSPKLGDARHGRRRRTRCPSSRSPSTQHPPASPSAGTDSGDRQRLDHGASATALLAAVCCAASTATTPSTSRRARSRQQGLHRGQALPLRLLASTAAARAGRRAARLFQRLHLFQAALDLADVPNGDHAACQGHIPASSLYLFAAGFDRVSESPGDCLPAPFRLSVQMSARCTARKASTVALAEPVEPFERLRHRSCGTR